MLRIIKTILLPTLLAMAMLVMPSDRTSAQEPQLSGNLPDSGVALVLWSGGTVDQLLPAARSQGCNVRSLWASDAGSLVGYVVDAPDTANLGFLSLFANGVLPPSTALILVCATSPRTDGMLDEWGVFVCDNYLAPIADWSEVIFTGFTGETVEETLNRLHALNTALAAGAEAMGAATPPAEAASAHQALATSMAWAAEAFEIYITELEAAEDIEELRTIVAGQAWFETWSQMGEASGAVTEPSEDAALALLRCRDHSPIDPALLEGRIAFASWRGGGGIHVMNADGSGLVRLTTDPGDSSPSWSPGGDRIAFQSNRSRVGGAACCDIYIASTDGGEPNQVTRFAEHVWEPVYEDVEVHSSSAGAPTWSPDGVRLAFECDISSVCMIDIDGSSLVRLVSGSYATDGPVNHLSWSPDGDQIAVSFRTSGIHIVNSDGSGLRPVFADSRHGWAAVWSPDGERIAFEADGELYVADVDGTNVHALRPVDPLGARDSDPVWSPDGTMIAFSSQRRNPEHDFDYEVSIYVVNVDGTGLTRLTDGLAADTEPSWAAAPE